MQLVSSSFKLLPVPLTAAQKRQATSMSDATPTKLPRASDIVIPEKLNTTTTSKPSRTDRKERAPLNVCIYPYTRETSDLWDLFAGKPGIPLYQVQLEHNARNSICFKIRDSFNAFLTTVDEAANGAMPSTLQELEKAAGVRLIVTDRVDPDSIGFQQWRVAFYVAGDVKNFLKLLNDFLMHKATEQDDVFDVELHPYNGVDLSGLEAGPDMLS